MEGLSVMVESLAQDLPLDAWQITMLVKVVEWLLTILAALLIFWVGRWVARRIANVFKHGMTRAGSDATLVAFVGTLAFGALMVLVVVTALTTLGVPSASLVAAVGAAGLAIGLALQGSLSNLASGVLLILFRPFRAGDYVEAGNKGGTVEEIGLMFTRMTTPDNVAIQMPNSQITQNPITNYSSNPKRRVDLLVGVAYQAEAPRAMEVILDVLRRDPRVLPEPEPSVMVMNLNESSVDIAVRPWTRREDYWPLRADLLRDIKAALDANGIEIPFPQRTVHVIGGGASPAAVAAAGAD